MSLCLASFLQRVEFSCGTQNDLPLPTLNNELAKSSTSGDAPAAHLLTTASAMPSNEQLLIALITPQSNGFVLQECDICMAEVVSETSEGISVLGYGGGISEEAVSGLPAGVMARRFQGTAKEYLSAF